MTECIHRQIQSMSLNVNLMLWISSKVFPSMMASVPLWLSEEQELMTPSTAFRSPLRETQDHWCSLVDASDSSHSSGDVPTSRSFEITESARSTIALTGRLVCTCDCLGQLILNSIQCRKYASIRTWIKISAQTAAEIFPIILTEQLACWEIGKCWHPVI